MAVIYDIVCFIMTKVIKKPQNIIILRLIEQF